jgi:hypothetical protein
VQFYCLSGIQAEILPERRAATRIGLGSGGPVSGAVRDANWGVTSPGNRVSGRTRTA